MLDSIIIFNIVVFKMVGGNEMPDINNFLENAVIETKNVLLGKEFLLRDLFKGYEWNRISRSDRLLLGTLFLDHVKTFKSSIAAVEKTSSGQQQYRKV